MYSALHIFFTDQSWTWTTSRVKRNEAFYLVSKQIAEMQIDNHEIENNSDIFPEDFDF